MLVLTLVCVQSYCNRFWPESGRWCRCRCSKPERAAVQATKGSKLKRIHRRSRPPLAPARQRALSRRVLWCLLTQSCSVM